MKIDLGRGPCIGGVDDRLAGPVRDPHEPALQRPLRMGKFGQPPKGGQFLMGALHPFGEQPRLEARGDFGKVRPGMGGPLNQAPRQAIAEIVDSLSERRKQVHCFGPTVN